MAITELGGAVVSTFSNVRVVMVNPSHGGNVGSAARAMKTMGMSDLVLVAPDNFPSDLAIARASGALDVLNAASVVARFEEAVADCRLVIGTSGRLRRVPWPLMDARTCGVVVAKEAEQGKVALVFGREARGLTNDELHQCHYHVQIPGNPDYSVLNVAAAIQVILYEVRMAICGSGLSASDHDAPLEDAAHSLPVTWVRWDAAVAPHEALSGCLEHVMKVLEGIGYYDPNEPRQTRTRLQRLTNRMRMDTSEVQLLRGVLTAIERAVKDKE